MALETDPSKWGVRYAGLLYEVLCEYCDSHDGQPCTPKDQETGDYGGEYGNGDVHKARWARAQDALMSMPPSERKAYDVRLIDEVGKRFSPRGARLRRVADERFCACGEQLPLAGPCICSD